MEEFCRRLKELRIEKGVKQKDICDALGLTPSRYSYFETGRNEPDLETLKKLADYFNVPSDYLIGRKNTKDINTNYFTNEFNQLSNENQLVVIGVIKAIKH